MIDLSDAHVYGGLTVLSAGLMLFHVGLGIAAFGAGLIVLGAWYSIGQARAELEQEAKPDDGEVH